MRASSRSRSVASRGKAPRWKMDLFATAAVGNISPLVAAVMNSLAEHKSLPRQRHSVELALREALANAIIHGSSRDDHKTVRMSVAGDAAGVRFSVADEGGGFNPKGIPDPLHPANLHAHHGRGLLLIRRLMDRVTFADRGREIRMWKRAPAARRPRRRAR